MGDFHEDNDKGPVIVNIPTWRLWVAHIAMGVCEAAYVVSLGRVDLDASAESITDWVIAVSHKTP